MRAAGILLGMDPQVAVLADREIALAPTGDVVELGGLRGGPAIGGLANRGSGIGEFDSGH